MFKTVFTINLNETLLAGRVAVGNFDGTHLCLVAATAGDKVLIHNPHRPATDGQASAHPETTFLNINQTINALAAGPLKPGHGHDVLVIGTPTSIFVYDVQNNSDMFYREIPDGANVVVIGKIGNIDKPLAIAGFYY